MTAVADPSAPVPRGPKPREQDQKRGVYRDVFEQSILLTHDSHRPWNFLASFGAECLVVAAVLLVPLVLRDRMPDFHWRDITIAPPKPLQVYDPPPQRGPSTGMPSIAPSFRPIFHLDPSPTSHPVPSAPASISPDAPPIIGTESAGPSSGPIVTIAIAPTVAPPPNQPAPARTNSQPIRVGGTVQMAKLIRKVTPEYPALAKMAHLAGTVHLIGTIGKDGTIQRLQIVDGNPLLARAAVEAVSQWIYRPTLLNNEPVEVIAPIEVNFTLGR
jgi:protein TonB